MSESKRQEHRLKQLATPSAATRASTPEADGRDRQELEELRKAKLALEREIAEAKSSFDGHKQLGRLL